MLTRPELLLVNYMADPEPLCTTAGQAIKRSTPPTSKSSVGRTGLPHEIVGRLSGRMLYSITASRGGSLTDI